MEKSENNSSGNSFLNKINMNMDSMAIMLCIALKTTALLPTIINVGKVKSVEEISILTPIFFAVSFLILLILSFKKKYYPPMCFFFIGLAFSSILLAQKVMYDFSESKNDNKDKYYQNIKDYSNEVNDYGSVMN